MNTAAENGGRRGDSGQSGSMGSLGSSGPADDSDLSAKSSPSLTGSPVQRWLDIVVVEDHDALREQLMAYLARPGWRLRGADCGEALDGLLRDRPADVVVLDLNLPFEDGTSIAQRLKMAFPGMGIVMLTARVRPADRTAGYANGADVYLTKPTNVEELESVIQNLARRLVPQPDSDSTLVLDQITHCLRLPGGEVTQLSAKEAQLLRLLAMAPDRQLDTDYLVHQLYHDDDTAGRRGNMTVLISRLRLKLNATAYKDLVRAVRGVGYRLGARMVVR